MLKQKCSHGRLCRLETQHSSGGRWSALLVDGGSQLRKQVATVSVEIGQVSANTAMGTF